MACSMKVSLNHLLTRLVPLVVLMAFLSADRAIGQLSDDDIAALREGWTFRVGHNAATRRSLDDLCGCLKPARPDPDGRPGGIVVRGELPAAFNWCDFDVCTPVRQQHGGTCTHFALNGAFEACINIVAEEPDEELDLSEQWLISCAGASPNFYLRRGTHTDACGGYGAVLQVDFQNEAPTPPCNCPHDHWYYLNSWGWVDPGGTPSVHQVKQAIHDHGPITTGVWVDGLFFSYGGAGCSTIAKGRG